MCPCVTIFAQDGVVVVSDDLTTLLTRKSRRDLTARARIAFYIAADKYIFFQMESTEALGTVRKPKSAKSPLEGVNNRFPLRADYRPIGRMKRV